MRIQAVTANGVPQSSDRRKGCADEEDNVRYAASLPGVAHECIQVDELNVPGATADVEASLTSEILLIRRRARHGAGKVSSHSMCEIGTDC